MLDVRLDATQPRLVQLEAGRTRTAACWVGESGMEDERINGEMLLLTYVLLSRWNIKQGPFYRWSPGFTKPE